MDKANYVSINTIRMLSLDMINKANSGHPGICLGATPIITTLYLNHLVQTPQNSNWRNRDRFILSAGHGSAMLYSTLHLAGFKITLDDLKKFRQLDSLTPGHPEVNHTDGIDATSGPLGQGIAMAVGMALEEQKLANIYNKDNFKIFDHYTYVLCGDGDLQEGVCQEALSLAGHLKLNKLIILYDSNDIQLDGPVSLTNTENVKLKYQAMGFNYIKVNDGNDVLEINKAIKKAKKSLLPTIIEVKTKIGYGSIYENSNKAHGSPLGYELTKKYKENINWDYEEFYVPNEAKIEFNKFKKRGKTAYKKYCEMLLEYEKNYPMLANNLNSKNNELNLEDFKEIFNIDNEATRKTSGKIIDIISNKNPNFIGGSADLSSSTFAKGKDDRNIYYGVREHAMASITNGLNLSGDIKAFCGGFFVFSDYMKPALRMSALMNVGSIYVFSHDSVMVGEDGPTHQPIEQLTQLRIIPNFNTIRPCDATECVAAWKIAYESKHTPTAIILSRQNVNKVKNSSVDGVYKGGYIVSMEKGSLDGIIIATGPEVSLAIKAQEELEKENIFIRVISMPSTYLYDLQDQKYKERILPKKVKKIVAIEMGQTLGWYKYANYVKGIDEFGVSAPNKDILSKYKFDVSSIIDFYKQIK